MKMRARRCDLPSFPSRRTPRPRPAAPRRKVAPTCSTKFAGPVRPAARTAARRGDAPSGAPASAEPLEFPNQDLTSRLLSRRFRRIGCCIHERTRAGPASRNHPRERQSGSRADAGVRRSTERAKESTLASVNSDIRVHGTAGHDFPYECSVEEADRTRAELGRDDLFVEASRCAISPILRERANGALRPSCGPCWDPIVAGATSYATAGAALLHGVTPPNECIYALGHYRPGSCARGCSTRCRCTGVRRRLRPEV